MEKNYYLLKNNYSWPYMYGMVWYGIAGMQDVIIKINIIIFNFFLLYFIAV